jgi:hypothetical protein
LKGVFSRAVRLWFERGKMGREQGGCGFQEKRRKGERLGKMILTGGPGLPEREEEKGAAGLG